MNNTAAQLVKQLGDKSEITIMSDVVYGLDFEYNQLQQENEGLKEVLRGTTHCFDEEEHQRLNNILTEFEKWLEEKTNYWKQQEEIWVKEGFIKFGGEANNKIIFKSCLDKLQELKRDNNEKV